MRVKHRLKYFLLFLFVASSCAEKEEKPVAFNTRAITDILTRMTEIMVHDVTNPPLAARFFSYACLAGYEAVSQSDSAYKSMYGILNDYPSVQGDKPVKAASAQLTALLAMMQISKKIQPSGSTMMKDYEDRFLEQCKKDGIDPDLIDASAERAATIATRVLAYAKADKYNRISNYPRYKPVEKEGAWYPTPPAYLDAVEPYFNTIRPFTLDSAQQFKPAPPVAFSSAKNSSFFKLMMQNYNDKLTDEHRAIAAFWDCNPFAVKENGHLMMSQKKISPGAHWMGITSIACQSSKKDFNATMYIHTVMAIGLMDAFISCWDEKYRSDRIRPETAIRKYIDPKWTPLLQTPPFPEYTSGHSVVSGMAATVLTHFFGDNFGFTDDVEVSYGLPARTFTSFNEAAKEAAISRFYGGIHYMDAIENGLPQGQNVGKRVIKKVTQ